MKDDSTAEELAVYSFSLLGASETVLDPSPSARQAQITVVASDDPYGIIEFQSASSLNVSEDIGFVNLTVVRNGGSIGDLSLNYSVSSTTATKGVDYESFGSGMVLCCFFFVRLLVTVSCWGWRSQNLTCVSSLKNAPEMLNILFYPSGVLLT